MRNKYRLMAPGPTAVPPEVRQATSGPMIHHRTPAYQRVFRSCQERLAWLIGTVFKPIFLCCSGTGAMEATVVNLLSAGDTALVLSAGIFAERWAAILRRYGVTVVSVSAEYGRTVPAGAVAEALKEYPNVQAVFCQHSETSTGVIHDIRSYADVVRATSAALVVDAVSSVGVAEICMDQWGIDVVVGASQKGLMLPPGLAFCTLSYKAREIASHSKLPKFYFDLAAEGAVQDQGDVRFTPAVDVMVGLETSLKMIEGEGLRNVYARHEQLATAMRAGCQALGLELFAKESPSPAITAICAPGGIDGEEIVRRFSDQENITIAGGQGPMKGKVFRIGHMGYCDAADVIVALSALERVLISLGYRVVPACSIAAAQEVFMRGCTKQLGVMERIGPVG